MTVGAITVTAQATSSPDQHDKQGSGDFYLAISGDLHLATNGDFYMATDIYRGRSRGTRRIRPHQSKALDLQDIVNASGSEDHYSVSFGDVEAGEPFMRVEGQALCLQMNTEGGGTAPAPIIAGMFVGQAALQTGDVALEHGTYDSVPYSSGIAEVGDRRLHLVVAETPEGRRGAIKFAPRKNDA